MTTPPSPALLVMAAGIGSRYGGLKQIDPVGPQDEIILDYSVYDALRAGFGRVVFLIRRAMEEIFRQRVGRPIERQVDTAYVFQELDDLPEGFSLPPGRAKPWGTGHAVLACRAAIHTPFAVINADDFYGAGAFQALSAYLLRARDSAAGYDYSMVSYPLGRTLSEHGHVARGVCQITPEGYLTYIREHTHIERRAEGIQYTENGADWADLPADTPVSLNTWGFTPSIFGELADRFPVFLRQNAAQLAQAEYFLPDVVGALVEERRARVRVLPVVEKWFGVTYPADRPQVQAAVRAQIAAGVYPPRLWD